MFMSTLPAGCAKLTSTKLFKGIATEGTRENAYMYTEYNLIRQISLPAKAVCHIWLPLRMSAISCFLPRLLCMINGFLLSLSA